MEIKKSPVIIVGSGIAGLLTALKLSDAGVSSIVVTKTSLSENSSAWAQGGIAAVLPENMEDSIELHIRDTLEAGAGLTDELVTRSIVSEGHLAIQDLIKLGVPFDREDGKLAFTKEGAHSTSRILHAGGDATGRSIQDTLIRCTESDPNIDVLSSCVAVELLVQDRQCYGLYAVQHDPSGQIRPILFLGQHIVLATGGIGRLYSHTTNPSIATGDGVALAYLAGADIQDMEFIQFHPTAFWANGHTQFLVSEALRGEGGILRDQSGRAFAKDYHPLGELAPRDIVTRAIYAQSEKGNRPFVWLDITHLPKETIERRFPTILQAALNFGVDIRTDLIPVSPAAHYGMGGVLVDTTGKTTVKNLYAVGEVVSSGLHGANRLASNSLLECVVLARRVAAHIETFAEDVPLSLFETRPHTRFEALQSETSEALNLAIRTLRDTMWGKAGILRTGEGLKSALAIMDELYRQAEEQGLFDQAPSGIEFHTMLVTSRLICAAALDREESRGAHFRTDFPTPLPEARHTIQHCLMQEEITLR